MRLASIAACFVGALAACGSTEMPDPCRNAPTWGDDIQPIVERTCLTCHSSMLQGIAREGAPEGLDFDEYPTGTSTLAALADALTSGRMPPPDDIRFETTADERLLTNDWRRCDFKQSVAPTEQ